MKTPQDTHNQDNTHTISCFFIVLKNWDVWARVEQLARQENRSARSKCLTPAIRSGWRGMKGRQDRLRNADYSQEHSMVGSLFVCLFVLLYKVQKTFKGSQKATKQQREREWRGSLKSGAGERAPPLRPTMSLWALGFWFNVLLTTGEGFLLVFTEFSLASRVG